MHPDTIYKFTRLKLRVKRFWLKIKLMDADEAFTNAFKRHMEASDRFHKLSNEFNQVNAQLNYDTEAPDLKNLPF